MNKIQAENKKRQIIERRNRRDANVIAEQNADLNKASNDLERVAIRAYATFSLGINSINDDIEDVFID